MPQPIQWVESKRLGTVAPSGRSGHTLTQSSDGYILFGGLDGSLDENSIAIPNNHLYRLRIRGGMVLALVELCRRA